MNTMVKLPDSRWPGWRRRLYWWMHEAVEAEEVISLDLETTSLDPRRADILSIGAVLVRRGKLVMGERLELSGRLHYAWISRNDDPSPRLGANDVQPGQALHANFSISYALDPHWRIGLAGYQLKQISADRIDGHRQADSREQVFGIGPGVMYSQGRQTLFVNLYAESGARNRSEGNQLTLRYLLAF